MAVNLQAWQVARSDSNLPGPLFGVNLDWQSRDSVPLPDCQSGIYFYCCAISMRTLASSSSMRSPDTSTVTCLIIPVKVKGA